MSWTILTLAIGGVLGYLLGLARDDLLAKRDGAESRSRFDPWDESGPLADKPTLLTGTLDAYAEGYQAGRQDGYRSGYARAWAAAELTAELRAERVLGVRERAMGSEN